MVVFVILTPVDCKGPLNGLMLLFIMYKVWLIMAKNCCCLSCIVKCFFEYYIDYLELLIIVINTFVILIPCGVILYFANAGKHR